MIRIKFNDWQEMALKKDTEAILKKMNSQIPIVFSLCWEAILSLGSIIIDHLFDTEKVHPWIWILCAISAIIPPMIILSRKVICWMRSIRNVKAGIYSIRNFVDTFDNQVCYWTMMSGSYSQLLQEQPVEKKNDRIFYYQEGCYYNNKSIHMLYKMLPVIDKVFSNKADEVIKKNLVALYRLQSIIGLLNQNQNELNKMIVDLNTDKTIVDQKTINKVMEDNIVSFISEINKLFSVSIAWNTI